MNKEQTEAVRRMAAGFAQGRMVCEHGLEPKEIIQVFHSLCLATVHGLKHDAQNRNAIVDTLLAERKRARDGDFT